MVSEVEPERRAVNGCQVVLISADVVLNDVKQRGLFSSPRVCQPMHRA